MTASPVQQSESSPVVTPTRDLALWVAGFDANVPEQTLTWARHTVMDWLGVTIAGAREPLSDILVSDALAENAHGPAHLIGRAEQVLFSQAALINGSASHALDYDDVHMRLHGHPSVPVLPALFALAEQQQASGLELLGAFIAGYEVECLLGEMMGDSHYDDGWHNTATVGTFGAAAACAKLLRLDAEKTAMALGIAATQAAGLKSMFGTMSKPLHAGKAALNGLLAARLASRGFTANPNAIECGQGFAATQSRDFQPLPIRPDPDAPYAIEANLFKYHAACYLTHSSIEAIKALREQHALTPADIDTITLKVSPGHLKVCHIPEPDTGLEIKFSLRHTAALAAAGEDTGALATYSDHNARREDLVALRRKVTVATQDFHQRTGAEVVILLMNGRRLVQTFDVGIPARDLDQQWQRLCAKFHSITDPVIGSDKAGRCIERCATLEQASELKSLLAGTTAV